MEKTKKMQFKQKRSKKFDTSKKFGSQKKQWQLDKDEIESLKRKYTQIECSKIQNFSDLPLSDKTAKSLQDNKFLVPTQIQQQSIGLALQGKDILGAAKTGSGKTLAFLIPVIECLYRLQWTKEDGLGALIISPTRELAYQIFEVLRKVGKCHEFSAGLVIGGKHVREEADRINTTNIVICTPGRLLQHMDETAYFHADNLQMLVLDEADRILDLGFQKTMNAIVENLPAKRQTLLFSATQTKSVRDLARLSLKDPMYVSVHENAQHSTPQQLEQSYLVCKLEDKIDLVWSFVKHHLKSKTLIFMASCKQVRFIHEVFRKLRPGVPVMALHGAMQQMKRMSVYDAFCRKQHAVLFATDIAARGLDFPAINWVIQLDCPEDANTYIHRAGRTARYEKDGEALLILLPAEEEEMVSQLQDKKIPVNKIKVNPRKQRSIQPKIASMLAADIQLKEFAQRAFMSYLKSVFFMSNKKVFDVTEIDTEAYAQSLGLAITPRVRFIEKELKVREAKAAKAKKDEAKAQKDMAKVEKDEAKTKKDKAKAKNDEVKKESTKKAKPTKTADTSSDDDSDTDDDESSTNSDDSSGGDSSDNETNVNFPKEKTDTSGFGDIISDEEDDLLKVKHKDSSSSDDSDSVIDDTKADVSDKSKKQKLTTKFSAAKKILKKQLKVNSKVLFTEEGDVIKDVHRKAQVPVTEDDHSGGINITQAKRHLEEEDKFDKQLYRDKIKKKHREQRIKEKEKKRKERLEKQGLTEEPEVILGNSGDESDEDVSEVDLRPHQDGHKLRGRESLQDGDSSSGAESGDEEGWDSAEYDSDAGPPTTKKPRFRSGDSGSDSSVSGDPVTMETGLSLEDDEMLALKLLQT